MHIPTSADVYKLYARQFITSHYPTLKKHNPDLPILIRQAKGTPARVFARFGAFTKYRPPNVANMALHRTRAGEAR